MHDPVFDIFGVAVAVLGPIITFVFPFALISWIAHCARKVIHAKKF